MLRSDLLDITACAGPYTLVPRSGFTEVWSAPERRETGIYLWCIAPTTSPGNFLVNYVGETVGQRGFEGRLWSERKIWFRQEDDRVDPTLFPQGIRRFRDQK